MAPVLAGAVAPDLPMFLFYAVEKLLLTTPERLIWSTRYFDAGWQDFFDVFNSLPLIGLALIVAVALRRRGLQLFFASMALHALCDLLLHHEDAHRHLFPFLDWRFASPISYWTPAITAASQHPSRPP